ncbi:MAG: ubiquinone biosynthesis protein [Alphaproteobacteria bacterium CG_4_9_14_3_um_filter_47_13]|nr:MAG: ubiquinone biosynthesis protein [Alphaproteobacteria bacterium CG_4_9_14_3_um_filter_47_13]
MKNSKTDILVIGGGVPGLALTSLLGKAGVHVTLVDQNPPLPFAKAKADSRTAALMQSSINILRGTGCWDRMRSYGEELRTLRIIDDSAPQSRNPVQTDFCARDIGLDFFGINMPVTPLRAALAETVQNIKTIHVLDAALTNYHTDDFGVKAHFDTDQTITAKLIVGADGRNSLTRRISGIKTREHPYGQSAITCLIHHTKNHDYISTEFHRPSGPFTLVPMPSTDQGFQSSLVWVDRTAETDRFMTWNKPDFEQALQDRSKDCLGKITLASTVHSWPLCRMQAQELTAKRTILIAEAAHVLHPMGAQGLNLSLRDVAALAETLVDFIRTGQDPGSLAVGKQYERRRHFDITSRVISTDGLTKIVSTHSGMAKIIRKLGLKTLDHVTFLKEFSMQQGLAPQMEGDRLTKGFSL